jgi:hypothetical protein
MFVRMGRPNPILITYLMLTGISLAGFYVYIEILLANDLIIFKRFFFPIREGVLTRPEEGVLPSLRRGNLIF